MLVVDEPNGDEPQDIITAILAPHHLAVRVGLRGVLLVVRARSVIRSKAGGRAAANESTGVIVGTVRDRATGTSACRRLARPRCCSKSSAHKSMAGVGLQPRPGHPLTSRPLPRSDARSVDPRRPFRHTASAASSPGHHSYGKEQLQCVDSPSSEASLRS
jgi:hypothetical protein